MVLKMKKFGQSLPLLAVVLLGCAASQPAAHPAMARASSDLECDESKLTRKTIDETTVEVRGCGKRAAYVKSCERRFSAAASATAGMPTSTEDCSWVPQSASSR